MKTNGNENKRTNSSPFKSGNIVSDCLTGKRTWVVSYNAIILDTESEGKIFLWETALFKRTNGILINHT